MRVTVTVCHIADKRNLVLYVTFTRYVLHTNLTEESIQYKFDMLHNIDVAANVVPAYPNMYQLQFLSLLAVGIT